MHRRDLDDGCLQLRSFMIRLDPAETIDVAVPQADGGDWVLKVPTLTGRA